MGGSDLDLRGADNPGPILAKINDLLLAEASANGIDNAMLAKCGDVDGDRTNGNQPCFEIKVVGRGDDAVGAGERFNFTYKRPYNGDLGLFSTPLKGTGNAVAVSGDEGGESKCVKTSIEGPDTVNDPCNWNILKYGESVQIPLFYEEKNPNPTPQNPGPIVHTLDMRDVNRAFFLRLRTPCEEGADSANADALAEFALRSPGIDVGEGAVGGAAAAKMISVPDKIAGTDFPRNCDAGDRVELSPSTNNAQKYLTFADDPVIVQWSLVDDNGKAVFATEGADLMSRPPRPDKRPNFEAGAPRFLDYPLNSQLSAGRLNKSTQEVGINIFNFINLVGTADLNDGVKHTFGGGGNDLSAFMSQYAGKRLYFNLKIIKKLRRNNSDSYVPHLEYQVLTSEPIADASTKILVTVRMWDMQADKMIQLPSKSAGNMFVLGNL